MSLLGITPGMSHEDQQRTVSKLLFATFIRQAARSATACMLWPLPWERQVLFHARAKRIILHEVASNRCAPRCAWA